MCHFITPVFASAGVCSVLRTFAQFICSRGIVLISLLLGKTNKLMGTRTRLCACFVCPARSARLPVRHSIQLAGLALFALMANFAKRFYFAKQIQIVTHAMRVYYSLFGTQVCNFFMRIQRIFVVHRRNKLRSLLRCAAPHLPPFLLPCHCQVYIFALATEFASICPA